MFRRRPRLTEAEREAFRADAPTPPGGDPAVRKTVFASQACIHCGGVHMHACPRVRRIVLDGGTVREVEYWPDGQWSSANVIFPWDVWGVTEGGADGAIPG